MYDLFKNSFGYIMPLTVVFILIFAIVMDVNELYLNRKQKHPDCMKEQKELLKEFPIGSEVELLNSGILGMVGGVSHDTVLVRFMDKSHVIRDVILQKELVTKIK